MAYKRNPIPKKKKEEAYKRNEYKGKRICIECGYPVNSSECELGHIKPVAHGGNDNLSNLGPQHIRSNRRLGARTIANPRGPAFEDDFELDEDDF